MGTPIKIHSEYIGWRVFLRNGMEGKIKTVEMDFTGHCVLIQISPQYGGAKHFWVTPGGQYYQSGVEHEFDVVQILSE